MTFPFTAYLIAAVSAFITAYAIVPFWRKWCLRIGLVDDPGHRKIHDIPVPLAGGLAVATGLLVPLILGAGLLGLKSTAQGHPDLVALRESSIDLLRYGLSRRAVELLAILVGALGMLILGALDDKHELRPGPKFAGQVLIASLVAAAGVRITLFVPNVVFSYCITIVWILTVINAFNFMDNMNGLCAGLGALGAWHFAALAAADAQYLVALIAFLTFGALIGFLLWNFPNGRIFLGDSGSHLVGYLLAVLAILPHFYTARHPRRWAVLIPLLVLGVPLFDLVRVVVVRWRIGQPFYMADNNHLSHRLVRAGLSRTCAVLLIWLAAAILGALACLY
jgi:UDP-GlcNAc:undecaprenyl-phosphate/decaprenyl-phosphate GlcNAc-1-phosphate transferase